MNSSGYLLQPHQIPQEAASISVGTDGTVSVELANGGGNQQIGQIQVARFINASGLNLWDRICFEKLSKRTADCPSAW